MKAISFLFFAAMLSSAAADWEKLPPLPEPSAGFICGAIGESVVVAGGTNWREDKKHWLDEIWVFAPEAKTWRTAGRLAAPLAYAAFGEAGDALWFAGGSNGEITHPNLSRLDAQMAVTNVARLAPRIVLGSAAILGGRLYAIGGAEDQARLDTVGARCFAIDLRSGATTRLADFPAHGHFVGTAAACAGRIFVFGGADWVNGEAVNSANAFSYSPAEDRWHKLPPMPSANRGLAAVVLNDETILLAGGYKNDIEEFTSEAFLFNVQRGEYRPIKPLPYRSLVGLVKCGNFIYCLGGEDKKKHRTDACYRIPVEELIK